MKNNWNLTPLFASDDDPKMEIEKKKLIAESQKFIKKWKERNDYLTGPKILREALDDYEYWRRNFGVDGKQGFYFSLRTAQDQTNPELKAKQNKVIEFSQKIENEMQFFEMRISRIDNGLHGSFLNSFHLAPYKHYLERLFAQADHLLSEPEEKIVNLKSQTAFSNWVRMTNSLLAKEEREVIVKNGQGSKGGRGRYGKAKMTLAQIQTLLSSQDKKERDSAGKAMTDIATKWAEVAEAEINSILGYKQVEDELRNFSRPDASRHLGDDIDSVVVDALVGAVSNKYDVAHRFYELLAKLLKQNKLGYHERVVAYGQVDQKFNFPESTKLVRRVFNRLDPEFEKIFQRYLERGQVDVFPRKGKASGAFCSWGDLMTTPTYVLLNYGDKIADALTIAHEFGHAINSDLMRQKQNALNFDSPVSVTEVASTFMEDFVLEEILKTADDELKLALMVMKLQEDVGTIFRQVACYRFEQDLHNDFRAKGYLSKEEIGAIFRKNMSAQNGPAVEMDSGAENWWVPWHHIRYYFYVYSYASGLLISKGLQAMVREDPKFIVKVKEFLSAGTSDSPKNIFAKMGIDISDPKFWDKGLNEVTSLLEATEKLAYVLGRIKKNN